MRKTLLAGALAALAAWGQVRVKSLVKAGDVVDGRALTVVSGIALNDQGEVAYIGTFWSEVTEEIGIFALGRSVIDTLKNDDFAFGPEAELHLGNDGNVVFMGYRCVYDPKYQHGDPYRLRTRSFTAEGIFLNDQLVVNKREPPLNRITSGVRAPNRNNSGMVTFVMDGQLYSVNGGTYKRMLPPVLAGVERPRVSSRYTLTDTGDVLFPMEWTDEANGNRRMEGLFTKSRCVMKREVVSGFPKLLAWSMNNAGHFAALDFAPGDRQPGNSRDLKVSAYIDGQKLDMGSWPDTNNGHVQINDRGTVLLSLGRNLYVIRDGQVKQLLSEKVLRDAGLWKPIFGRAVLEPDEDLRQLGMMCRINNNDMIACNVRGPRTVSAIVQVSEDGSPVVNVGSESARQPDASLEAPAPEAVVTVLMRNLSKVEGQYVGGDSSTVYLKVNGSLVKVKTAEIDTVMFPNPKQAKTEPQTKKQKTLKGVAEALKGISKGGR